MQRAHDTASQQRNDSAAKTAAQALPLDPCQRNECTPGLLTPNRLGGLAAVENADTINERRGRGTLQPERITQPPEWSL